MNPVVIFKSELKSFENRQVALRYTSLSNIRIFYRNISWRTPREADTQHNHENQQHGIEAEFCKAERRAKERVGDAPADGDRAERGKDERAARSPVLPKVELAPDDVHDERLRGDGFQEPAGLERRAVHVKT